MGSIRSGLRAVIQARHVVHRQGVAKIVFQDEGTAGRQHRAALKRNAELHFNVRIRAAGILQGPSGYSVTPPLTTPPPPRKKAKAGWALPSAAKALSASRNAPPGHPAATAAKRQALRRGVKARMALAPNQGIQRFLSGEHGRFRLRPLIRLAETFWADGRSIFMRRSAGAAWGRDDPIGELVGADRIALRQGQRDPIENDAFLKGRRESR